MLYYSKEARETAVKCIGELIGKIADVPGDVLNNNDSGAIIMYLSTMRDAIKREQKEEDRR